MLEDAKVVEAVAQVVTVFLLGKHGQSQAVTPEADGGLQIAGAYADVNQCGGHAISPRQLLLARCC
jgi:hypothetical protein